MRPVELPEVKVAALALNLWFVGQAIAVVMPATTEAGAGEWISSVSAVIMVAAGLMSTASRWNHLPRGLQSFIIAGTLLLIPMTLSGILKGMDDPLYTALQALPWYAAIFLPALGYPRVPESLLTCFRWHAFLGVIAAAVMVAFNWEIISASSINREETLGIKVVQFLLYSLFFQFFRITTEGFLHRLVVLAGLSLMVIIAIASGTRQAILLISLVIVMACFSSARTVQGLGASAFRKAGLFVTASLFLGAVIAYILSNLQGAVDLFSQRLTSERSGTSLADNSRIAEIHQLLEQFGPADYALGRGLRGQFDNSAAPKQDNVHIGWFRTLLKGGIPMVLLLLLGYVGVALRAAARSRDDIILAAAFVVIYFGVKNATGNIILANGHFYIVAICAGTIYSALQATPHPSSHRRP